jgi:hypothetical protein
MGWVFVALSEDRWWAAVNTVKNIRVVAPCRLVDVYRRFKGACCLHHQGDADGSS